MKQSTFNNLNKESLYEVILNLCELGFSDPFILDLLSKNYSFEKIERYVKAARKKCHPVSKNESCHQKSIRYLAKLCVKSEAEAMTQAEMILKDFLWERAKFRELREYITGLIAATYINICENHRNYFDVEFFLTEYLMYIYKQSILDCPEWKYGFPSCIGELRTQMARFIAQTKDSECSRAGLIFATLPLEQLG